MMGYEAVFKNKQLMTGFVNSFIYMIVGTVINLFMTLCCAFPLSRKEFVGRNVITTIFVFTMYFGGGLVPSYMLINNLGLLDTRWVMVIPTAMSVWNVILCRTYLQSTIPDTLFEAAQLDGCGEIRFLISIVTPLSKPILAVLALYYGVGHWNSYFHAMIYLNTPKLFPLQIVLRDILILGKIDPLMIKDVDALVKKQGLSELLKYAVIVVASVPVLCIYPFVQKYFVSGVMIGALKG
ncbi:MAG: carbohydrate ABC transporter permease [Niameybacter sp.]